MEGQLRAFFGGNVNREQYRGNSACGFLCRIPSQGDGIPDFCLRKDDIEQGS